MNKSEKLNYIPFYSDGLTSCFPPSFPCFFSILSPCSVKGTTLGQDGYELCVQCPPHLPPKSNFSQYLAMEQYG